VKQGGINQRVVPVASGLGARLAEDLDLSLAARISG
jgi:hypothetical protein